MLWRVFEQHPRALLTLSGHSIYEEL